MRYIILIGLLILLSGCTVCVKDYEIYTHSNEYIDSCRSKDCSFNNCRYFNCEINNAVDGHMTIERRSEPRCS